MTPNRRFLYEVLGMGVELGCITPEDLIGHITPEVLAHHLPVALKARLLQASLDAERMTPAVIVEAVGIEALVEHSPMPALWACVRTAAERQVGAAPERRAPERVASERPGNGAVTLTGEDLALKPPKSTRGIQRSSRVSSLSPRSRVIRRDDSADGGRRDDAMVRDFEVVDETDVRRPSGSIAPVLSPGDEEARPGPKS